MNKLGSVVVMVAVLAAVSVAGRAGGDEPAPGPAAGAAADTGVVREPSRIAFVNLGRVVRDCRQTAAAMKGLEETMLELKDLQAQRARELKELAEEIAVLAQDSALRADKERRLAALSSDYAFQFERLKQTIEVGPKKNAVAVIARAREAVRRLAREEGFLAVLNFEDAPYSGPDLDYQIYNLQTNVVITVDPSFDITSTVIALLDRAGEEETGGRAAGEATDPAPAAGDVPRRK